MNLKKLIREELDDFDWVQDQDPLFVGSCITKHLHKLHPETHGLNSETYKEFGPTDLDYIIVDVKGDEIIIRPKSYPNEEKLYRSINKKELSNNIINKKISFCEY